jgi:hypothetical protein
MQHLHIFIDEFGNANRDEGQAGAFFHYVLTAVLIEEANHPIQSYIQ